MRKIPALLAAALTVLALAGCGPRPNPCAQLGTPSVQDKASAASGREVEIELDDGTECVLQGDRWVAEYDS